MLESNRRKSELHYRTTCVCVHTVFPLHHYTTHPVLCRLVMGVLELTEKRLLVKASHLIPFCNGIEET